MPSHDFSKTEDVRQVINDLQNQLNQIRIGNWDLHERRIVGAAASVDPEDYVIQKELSDRIANLQDQINSVNKVITATGETIQLPQELFVDCTSLLNAPFGSFGDVPGCALSLNRQGLYVVSAAVFGVMSVAAGELRIYLDVDTVNQTPRLPILLTTGTGGNTIEGVYYQFWPVTNLTGTSMAIKLVADKAINAGTAVVGATHTRLHARWVGPPNGYSVTV